MRVMVLGATGFIGPALVRRLALLGHRPIALSHRGGPGDDNVAAERSDVSAVASIASEYRVDAVVDLLAMTLDATRPLLDALSGRVGRYVLASSGDVYRQYGALQRIEPGGAPRARLDEDAPLRTALFPYRKDAARDASDPQAWMDDYDKIPIERAVAERLGAAGTVVRLPMVFGPGDRQHRFAWAIRPMLAGAPTLEIDSQWAGWRTSYGFVEDVAQGLALAAVHPAAAGRTYNLGPSTAPSQVTWARRIARRLGWTGEIRLVPRDQLDDVGRRALDALDLRYPLVLDSRRIRAELGYAEVTGPARVLRRTIEDELSRAA